MRATSALELPPGPVVVGFPETPVEALGELHSETVLVDERSFSFIIPEQTERVMDHPAVRSTFAATDFLPYWADLWPAARMLAKVILREPWPSAWTTPGAEQPEVLELGCGLGLPGVTALSCGLRVVFSDYDLTAMRFAAANAVRNGHSRFRLLPIDWTQPPTDFRVPLILASDLTFERRHVAPIVALLKRVLLPGGVCLLTDQDRLPAADLRAELHHAGLPYTKQLVRAGVPGGERFKGTLYRITRE